MKQIKVIPEFALKDGVSLAGFDRFQELTKDEGFNLVEVSKFNLAQYCK